MNYKQIKQLYKAGGILGLGRLLLSFIDAHSKKKLVKDKKLKYIINGDLINYALKFNYFIDLSDPKNFTEKIHVYKLLYDDPKMSKIVDKYEFKGYIKDILGTDQFSVKSFGVIENYYELEKLWPSLPEEFVLKSTISSDGNNIIFVNDKNKLEIKSIKNEIEKMLNPYHTQLNGYSRAYYSLKPRVVIEEYLHEIKGSGLQDYKFYCFNGEVAFVYVTSRTFESKEDPSGANYPRTFFDLEWKKLPISLVNHPTDEKVAKPSHFEEMKKIAKKLSQGFPFVRIDFYNLEKGPLLGEMTFYPAGGFKHIYPIEFDEQLGAKFLIDDSKLIKI